MTCKLCGEEKKLIKSHIIPESFYRDAYIQNQGCMVSKNDYSKRLPIGIYDKEIVCDECEKTFQKWDDYGYEFFYKILTTSGKTIQKNGENIGLLFNKVKYNELKLFLMSVLWRASVCGDDFFDQISLGLFENILKENIISAHAGTSQEFAVLIFKFEMSNYDILHPPFKARLDGGVNGYRLFFFNAEVFIKVDKRAIKGYSQLILTPAQQLIVSLKAAPEILRLLDGSRGQ